jgi:hypothetical protein
VQVATPHVVPTQEGVPFCTAHTAPQAPQFATSFLVAFSQPSLTAALQFANPVLHVIEHAPLPHFAVPLVVSQASPHPPQFFRSLEVSVSQPFDTTPSQSANGVMQDATSHEPEMHVPFA